MSRHKPDVHATGEAPPGPEAGRSRIGLLRPDRVSLFIAFALAVTAAIYAYLSNMALNVPEQAFVLAVFYVAVHSVRWAMRRRQPGRPMK